MIFPKQALGMGVGVFKRGIHGREGGASSGWHSNSSFLFKLEPAGQASGPKTLALLFTSPQPGHGVPEGQPTLSLGTVPPLPTGPRAGHTHWRALLISHCPSGAQDNLPAGGSRDGKPSQLRRGKQVGEAKLSSGSEAGPEGRVD